MGFAKNVPTAVVNLDKPRTIALTLDALSRLEEILGLPLMEIGLDANKIVSKLDAWIWAGLDDADRAEISAQEIREMIHLGNIAELGNAVTSLITASVPDPTAGKPSPAPPKVQRAVAGRR